MPPLIKEHWPPPLIRPEVRGVHVGGCVDGGRRFRRKAHAHTEGEYRGWICYLGKGRLGDVRLARHELAHILSGRGHDDKWRAVLAGLWGGAAAVPREEWIFEKVPRTASRWCRGRFHGMCKGQDEGTDAREDNGDTRASPEGPCRCSCHSKGFR